MPGFVPQGSWHRESRDIAMMVCTAGHVDHGKTSLVHWLTGCETDVLRQERERGLTIEVGFAPCSTLHGISIGITDVPGHERFIRNMVAGVAGIEMCILVIAADDGIMPQTIEHFQIMELLGVRRGIVALTKADLVDPVLLESRMTELRAWLDEGVLRDAPVCPVSSVTGDGIPAFYETLSDLVRTAVREEPLGVFRMPIERVFTMQGFGRVLSGIPMAGSIAEGDMLELVPGGAVGRLRGMQCFGRASGQGRPGLCLALNVPDLAREQPRRGQVRAAPGRLRPASVFHSRLTMLDHTGLGVKNGERVALHTGTAEVQARLYALEAAGLAPGDRAWVALVTDEPVAAAACDRYIIRKLSPIRTLGGGCFSDASPDPARPRKAAALQRLRAMATHYPEVGYRDRAAARQLVAQTIELSRPDGIATADLRGECLLPDDLLADLTRELEAEGAVRRVGRDRLLHTRTEQALCEAAAAALEHRFAAGETLIPVTAYQPAVAPAVKTHILQRLAAQEAIALQGGCISPCRPSDDLTPEQQLATRLLDIYRDSGFMSPREDELPGLLDASAESITPVLGMLLADGALIRLSPKVILARPHVLEAQRLAVAAIRQQGGLEAGAFRAMLNSTRKYAVSILEYFDRLRITLRDDNVRHLTANHERRLLS